MNRNFEYRSAKSQADESSDGFCGKLFSIEKERVTAVATMLVYQ